MTRYCKCCDIKTDDLPIKCGYCGDTVYQGNTNSKYGKWFHVECFSQFRNFYSSLFNIDAVESRKDLKIFRDHILFEMIMRNDLRILRQQWSLLVAGKAIPIDFKEKLIAV